MRILDLFLSLPKSALDVQNLTISVICTSSANIIAGSVVLMSYRGIFARCMTTNRSSASLAFAMAFFLTFAIVVTVQKVASTVASNIPPDFEEIFQWL